MELKLTIYADRLCRKVKEEKKAQDFELSTAVCEDLLNVINIDLFDGGLEALSGEGGQKLMLEIVKNGYPFFLELVKEIFEVTDADGYFKLGEIAGLILKICKYAVTQLVNSIGGKTEKN